MSIDFEGTAVGVESNKRKVVAMRCRRPATTCALDQIEVRDENNQLGMYTYQCTECKYSWTLPVGGVSAS